MDDAGNDRRDLKQAPVVFPPEIVVIPATTTVDGTDNFQQALGHSPAVALQPFEGIKTRIAVTAQNDEFVLPAGRLHDSPDVFFHVALHVEDERPGPFGRIPGIKR